MVIAELLMKRPTVQIVIAVTIQPQHLLHQRQRHPLRRRLPTPPIKQSVIAEPFVTFAPAPHVPLADADDLRCLPPRDLLRHGPQNHFLYFHRTIHRGLRVREHACHVLLPSPPEKRTDHVLSQPDISCANDTDFWSCLTTSCLPPNLVCLIMKVLVIGSGGREDARVWNLRQSPRVTQVYVATRNS